MYAQELVIANMLEQVKDNYDTVYDQINTIIKTTGTVVTDTGKQVVEDTPGVLDPLIAKYSTYKDTILGYIKEITDKMNTNAEGSIASNLTGLAGTGGALQTFSDGALTEFGKATGYANLTSNAVKGIGTSLFGLVNGENSAFTVFKNLALTNITSVSDEFKNLGIEADKILSDLNTKLGFNEQADLTVKSVVTDNIETMTTKVKEVMDNIEKDVYDNAVGGASDFNHSDTPIEVPKTVETKIQEIVNNAEDALNAEVAAPEEIASKVEDALTAEVAAPEEIQQPAKQKKATTTAQDKKKTTGTSKLDDKTKKYVAAAIVNGNQGWGSGDERKKLLTEVFGANNGIQAIVDADRKNGYAQASKIIKQLGSDGIKAYSYLNMRKKYKGYKKGTTGVPSDDTFWTHPDELIIRRNDGAVLTPLSKGSPVFPANLADNLWKWGSMTPADFMKGFGPIANPEAVSNNVVQVTNNYESLLTVNGNVDKDALPELQEILKQACEYTNKYNAREARKLGKK